MTEPFVDPGGLLDFWAKQYLGGYLPAGGSSVKWLSGAEGSGKTSFLRALREQAAAEGFCVAAVDASQTPIGRFDEVYRVIMAQIDPDRLARQVAVAVGRELGAQDWTPGGPEPLWDHVTRVTGRPRQAILDDMRRAFDFLYAERNIVPSVAVALRRLAEPLIRQGPTPEDISLARAWLSGARMTAKQRKSVGIYLTLDRYSARDVFRSLLYAYQICGGKGVVVTVDRMDTLVRKDEGVKYTKLRREDAYEGLRETIDEGGRLPGLFMVCAGRNEVFHEPRWGLSSYPALAMRVVSEIASDRVNRFNDLQDLDVLWKTEWSAYASALLRAHGGPAVTLEDLDLSAVFSSGAVSPVKQLLTAMERSRGEGREAQ